MLTQAGYNPRLLEGFLKFVGKNRAPAAFLNFSEEFNNFIHLGYFCRGVQRITDCKSNSCWHESAFSLSLWFSVTSFGNLHTSSFLTTEDDDGHGLPVFCSSSNSIHVAIGITPYSCIVEIGFCALQFVLESVCTNRWYHLFLSFVRCGLFFYLLNI